MESHEKRKKATTTDYYRKVADHTNNVSAPRYEFLVLLIRETRSETTSRSDDLLSIHA